MLTFENYDTVTKRVFFLVLFSFLCNHKRAFRIELYQLPISTAGSFIKFGCLALYVLYIIEVFLAPCPYYPDTTTTTKAFMVERDIAAILHRLRVGVYTYIIRILVF